MKKGAKRILAALLSLSMLISTWTPAITAEAALIKTETANVAQNVPVSSEQTAESGHEVKYVNDGNVNTTWQTQGAWPSKVTLELGAGKDNISKVVVKLGGQNNQDRSVLVTVQYAINNITSDLVTLKEERVTLSGNKQLECSIANPISATHLYVTLSEPLDGSNVGAFWPSVAEIEVYEEQSVTYSNYNNIANQAVISTTGNEHTTDGSKNLVDGKDNTLYKFHKDQMTGEKTVTLRFDQARKMDAFRIAFEYVNPNSYNYQFNYSIHARNGEAAYDVIAENITADRAVNWQQYYKFTEKTYSEVKIIMHSCTTDVTNDTPGGYGWPAIAEFEVYGNELEVEDPENIALKCDVYSSSGKTLAKNVTDGSKNSTWEGDFYPDYVDINLGKNYDLEAVEVYTPGDGYSQYSIYTSMDGRDFEKLAEKTSHDVVAATAGERYDVVDYDQDGREARIVRVYLEYNSATTKAVINEVRVMGTESNTEIQNRPEINIPTFDQLAAQQAVTLTPDANATYQEVYGIIERRLGASYKNWFTLELAENTTNTGYDYYELFMKDGKVHVKGNDGVSLATGINYYLKYFCNVNISQVGDQVKMPAQMPTITNKIHKETKAEVRYSYNYCTLSYSMAFWGEEEWRNELDWLALNGVNVVLDATAQEEVWRRFLGKIGYEHEAIKDFTAGPAYYAWAYMANLSGFGGPVHDSWFVERTELARKNQQIMRNLGMQPVLQGYSGMVPTDIVSQAKGNYKITQSDVIAQSEWNKFQRPTMLVTTSEIFDKYAALFYECQEEVYGATSDYYATDPFHEGGTTGGMQPAAISQHVLESLLAADEDGIWIIQAWEGNPSSELLKGLKNVTDGANHALVLDLYAEKEPRYDDGHASNGSYGYAKEFDSTPWVFCMLNNFGGRLGLHGHLDNLAEDIPKALNTCSYIKGIGITPEASVNNPVLYDFLFETVWQNNVKEQTAVIDLNTWLDDYATRRYGEESESANQAWDILLSTVYNSTQQNSKQGAPESIVNARPALSISAASTWGSSQIVYDKAQLEKAAKLLLKDYDKLKNSEGYLYDVATLLQQVLSNSAQTYHGRLASAFNAKDVTAFTEISKEFMGIIDAMEQVTSTSEYYLLGRWVEQAKGLAQNADDFSRDLYEINAKALITTWGSYNQAEGGRLKDYSNRQWAGLLNDFYKARWERWITARTNELNNTSYESNINWFQWEWEWVRNNAEYETTPTTTDLSVLGAEILEKYSVVDENSDDSRDVDPSTMEVEAGTQSGGNLAEYVLDGKTGTIWHSDWSDSANTSSRNNHYLIFTMDETETIDGMRYLPRQDGTNGIITKFDLYVSTSDSGDDWQQIVDDGVLNGTSWQLVSFEAKTAKRVKLQIVDAKSDQANNMFASAAEIRFTMPAEVELVDKTELKAAIDRAKALEASKDDYTTNSWAEVAEALAEAEIVFAKADATQQEVTDAVTVLKAALAALAANPEDDRRDISTEKYTATAGSTQDGNSTGSAIDGSEDTYWEATWGSGGGTCANFWYQIELDEETKIEALRYLPRFGSNLYNGDANGFVKAYRVEVSNGSVSRARTTDASSDGLVWETVAEGRWDEADGSLKGGWKIAEFKEPVTAKYVRLVATETYAANGNNKEMSAVEIRVKAAPVEAGVVDKTELTEAIATANVLTESKYTVDSWKAFQEALSEAKTVNNNENASQDEINQAITSLKNAQAALKLFVANEKEVILKVGEIVSFLDVSGTYDPEGLKDLDSSIATVNVETKTFNDAVAKLFNYATADTTPALERYTGASISLSDCIYTFEKAGEDTYHIYGITENGEKVYLNVNDSANDVGCPNTTAEEVTKVTKITSQTGVVEGFSFQDMDINNANGSKYTLQFIKNWGVFNENTTDSNAQKLTTFKVKELSREENGSYVCTDVTEIQDGGSYIIVAAFDSDADGTIDVEYVLRPSASSTGAKRNDHVALVSNTTSEGQGNKVTITGVSVGTTSIIVGTTKYNIQVVEEKAVKDVTVRAGETVRIFDQSGTFEESGLNTLDTTKATAGVETTTIKDKVATLHSGDANYDGTAIDLNNCLYTFNKNADGTYTIVAVTEDGKTVYLNPYTGMEQKYRGFPSTETPENITIVEGENGFSFLDQSKKITGNQENYRLTFVNEWKVFNENPGVDNGGANVTTTTEFKVYQLQKSDNKYVYTEVTDLSAIQDGAQYYIAAPVDGVEYVLRPSASTISTGSRNDHIAKVTTEEKTVTGNEILINGEAVGDTQMTVGNTVYNIHVVPNEQNIEIKKGQSIILEGSSLTKNPEGEYATINEIEGENRYQLTGVLDGETTFVLDGVTYHVTVLKEDIASSVGTSNGMKLNELTMSANNTFDLCVINSESAIKEWKIIDKETGEVAEWASIDANGTVSAKNKADSVEHNGYIVAELADGTRIQIELKLSPAPTGTDLRLYDIYIDDLHHTDVWYGWIYEYDNPNPGSDNAILCDSTALTKAVEGEVIYVSMGGNYSNALDFFARPEDGYALTQMGATGSHGHYMRLEGETPEDTEFISTPSVAGNGQYHEISADATRKLVQLAMDIDCHGAQGFTRKNDDGTEGVSSILNYRSEKLPTVEKTVYGIGSGEDYRPYTEGATAEIGEYVYFKVEVETYPITGEYFDDDDKPLSDAQVVEYNKVELIDKMLSTENAVFIPFENIGKSNPLENNVESTKDITQDILSEEEFGQIHEYYVAYQISEEDVKNIDFKVKNTVNLNCIYESYYSSGEYDSQAESDAEIYITTQLMKNLVLDFGLSVKYIPSLEDPFVKVPDGATEASETVETKYGEATITTKLSEGKYSNEVVYTPTEPLQEVDAIPVAINGAAYKIEVYPATTVYYEEDFANYTSGSGWTFPAGETQSNNQAPQYLEETSVGNYGYDEKYAVEAAGPSNDSEAVSAAAGDTAEFTFKGEGIDIYANCQSEQAGQPTGTVTVLIKDKNNAIEKLMIVNTKIAGDPDGITNAQNSIANAYNMPVISVNGLEQGEHSVKIVHTRSKEESEASTAETTVTYPIRLDGFRVYNTLGKSEQSVYEGHKEANPNFTEMRNVVLNALNISSLYDETNDETNAESLYAEDIANGLTQVLDKKENGANAIILDNTVSSTDYDADNAQDFLDNGPKNELFLYQNQTLTFKLNAGLKNVQLGLKAANGPVTVTGTIAKNISSSTDMFYVIGDIDADTVITITNTSSNILSVTDLKYFTATPDAKVFCEITEETLTTALSAMGYPRKNETQEPADTIVRIAGSDRYATAYAVAEELKEVLGVDKFDAVIVATGKNFADALSGSYLASVKNAPILLTNEKRTEELVEYVKANLAEDGIVYILGGTAAVPGTVEAGLEGIDVKRLYGEDRYGTNRAVLKEVGAVGRELLIATGRGYADSLSASATGKPILLVKDEITDAHREILRGFDGGKFYIIGGTGAVSEEIQAAIVGQGRIYRIAGENRYETSAKVAETFFPEAQTACFAYAKEFADGLSGGPLAAALGAPMILTADGKTDDAAAYVQSREIQSGIVFGGTARISDEAVGEIF